MLHRKALPIFCHNRKSRTFQCRDAIRAAHWLDFGGMDLVCRLTLHEQLYKVLHFGGRQHDQRSRFPPRSEHCVAIHFFDVTALAGPLLDLLEHGSPSSKVSPIFWGQNDVLCLELFPILR